MQLIGFHFVDSARLPLEEISYCPLVAAGEKDPQNLSHSKNKVIRSFFLLTGTGKGLMVELGNKSLKSKILTVIYKIN